VREDRKRETWKDHDLDGYTQGDFRLPIRRRNESSRASVGRYSGLSSGD
jgi:hypothetical protein